ncbi:MAG: hypothetical protein ACJAR2_000737 [Ilumatobacter sp.]
MGVDEHVPHARGFVVLGEPHAAHVVCEIVDALGPSDGCERSVTEAKVGNDIFRAVVVLVLPAFGFEVDGPDSVSIGT